MNPMVKMVLTLAVISAGAAAALSAANQATADKIKAAAEAKAARAVQKIFPDCAAPQKSEAKSPTGEVVVVYRCPRDRTCFSFSSNAARGISRPYSGPIKTMIGVDGKGELVGLRIIQQSETPGLGNKIVEDKFLGQFKGKSASANWKVRKDDPAGVIDGLSGATISSRTVTSLVSAALRFYDTELKGAAPGAAPGASATPGGPGCDDAFPGPAYDNRGPVRNPARFGPKRPAFRDARRILKREMDQQRAREVGPEQDGRPVRPKAPNPGQEGEP